MNSTIELVSRWASAVALVLLFIRCEQLREERTRLMLQRDAAMTTVKHLMSKLTVPEEERE